VVAKRFRRGLGGVSQSFRTAIFFSPYLIQRGIYPSGVQWIYLAGFGMFQLGIPYLLFARSLSSISIYEASGLALLEPLLVPVWLFGTSE
jgi:DME family drug/metabolite transporter